MNIQIICFRCLLDLLSYVPLNLWPTGLAVVVYAQMRTVYSSADISGVPTSVFTRK